MVCSHIDHIKQHTSSKPTGHLFFIHNRLVCNFYIGMGLYTCCRAMQKYFQLFQVKIKENQNQIQIIRSSPNSTCELGSSKLEYAEPAWELVLRYYV